MPEKESHPGQEGGEQEKGAFAGAAHLDTSTISPNGASPYTYDYEADLAGAMRSPTEIEAEQIAAAIGRSGDKVFWSAGELLAAQFADPVWAVPGLVPAGLTILAGRPKLGKSWLALQMAIAAGSGGLVFGEQVERRNVLYLALEDSPRRLKDRLSKQGCPTDALIECWPQWPALITSTASTSENGLDRLLKKIETGGFSFVIVDTLARFASVRKLDDELQVAQRLAELQRYAVERNVAVLLVTHHRKAGAYGVQDLIDDVMGASSTTAIADAALGLYRARGQPSAELKLTGRDVPDRELAVQFDKTLFCWQLLGDAAGVKAKSVQAAILEAMTETFKGKATCSKVAQFLGKDRANVYREMAELVIKGKLTKAESRAGVEVDYRVVEQEND